MSEVDRLSNSGLYPALPIADKRPSRDGSSGRPPADNGSEIAPGKPLPEAAEAPDPATPRPPKSLIDEYA
jgi:hypothetical protein